MPRSLDISVIICTRSLIRWQACAEAIQSIQTQKLPAFEILLVVDHNPDLLRQAHVEFPQVRVLENTDVQGLSGARNSGIRAANGDIIAFMDDDALAPADWMEKMAAHYQDSAVYGVGGRVEPLWLAGRADWLPEEFYWVVGCSWRGTPTTPSPVRNFIGANMSYRREVFEAIGGFRTGMGRVDFLPLGCEETELCIRLHQHYDGAILLYDPAVQVRHRVPADRTTWAYFRARCYSEGISKAAVSRFVGSKQGLSAEWKHTLVTLPTGVLAALGSAARHLKPAYVARAGAIIAGLAITTAGYLAGGRKARAMSASQPNAMPTATT